MKKQNKLEKEIEEISKEKFEEYLENQIFEIESNLVELNNLYLKYQSDKLKYKINYLHNIKEDTYSYIATEINKIGFGRK